MIRWLIIFSSFLFSLILTVQPLPPDLLGINPNWCLLTLIFWTYGYSRQINVGMAWCVGLLVDGLTGALLGLHALSFVIVIFLFDLFYRRFHMFHVLQQSLIIGVLILVNFLILLIFGRIFSLTTTGWPELISVFTSALLWPLYQWWGQAFYSRKG